MLVLRFVQTFSAVPLAALMALLFSSCNATEPANNIRLPAVFSDQMVIQRDMPVVIWGRADPGGVVTAKFDGATATAIAKSDSHWTVELPPREAGGPFVMEVSGVDTLTFSNILAGDVWICSGQSNMEWSVQRSSNADEEIETADFENIRLFDVAHTVASVPQHDVNAGAWQPVTPETVGSFSAVAYFFGREVHRETGVPIGLISTNWGGTRAEAWTSREGLADLPHFAETAAELATFEHPDRFLADEQAEYDSSFARWEQALLAADEGIQNGTAVYAEPDLDVSDWPEMELPQAWEGAGLPNYDGIVWFRKSFDVPNWLANRQMLLYLGSIDDRDQTWINGVKVGETDRYNAERIYQVASDIMVQGSNVVSVRVLDTGGGGGFMGMEADLRIERSEPSNAMPIPLAGTWRYRPAVPMGDLPAPPSLPRVQDIPSVLYNGMIAGLTPLRIKGAIWYQGESNASRAFEYRTLFQAMISDWRRQWGQGDFPFLFVQLANYMTPQTAPDEKSDWAELREAQAMALDLENTGMAVIIDIGEADDIHPRNKQDVGSRLAQSALAIAYGKEVLPSGPIYREMTVEGSRVRLSFDFDDQGLVAEGDSLKGFTIAGPDSHFVWADAVIEGRDVVVSSPAVATPIAVRYGWADNPDVNLYGGSGLPASPFRTDSWRGVTQPK
jgi:sialate O-acetylesterase